MRYANDGLRFLLAALFGAGSAALAVAFATLVVMHLGLTFALGQRPARTAR
jgi:hypothetical protein